MIDIMIEEDFHIPSGKLIIDPVGDYRTKGGGRLSALSPLLAAHSTKSPLGVFQVE